MNLQEKEFFQAAQSCDFEKIFNLMNTIDANIQNEDGNTALMIAVQNGCIKMAEQLSRLEIVHINKQNKEGKTALMLAVDAQNKDMVHTLLHNTLLNINLETQDKNGDTALLLAIKKGNLDIVDDILSQVPNPAEAIPFVQTMEASDLKDNLLKKLTRAQKAYNLVLFRGATDGYPYAYISQITSLYRHPLAIAIRNEDWFLIKYLLESKYSPNYWKGKIDVNQVLNLGVTPLMIAIQADIGTPLDIIRYLLERGANPNIPRFDGKTSVSLVYDPEILERLVKYDADMSHSPSTAQKLTQAVKNYEIETLRLGDYEIRDENGNDPLMIAVQNNRIQMAQKLSRFVNNNLNEQNKEGKTALILAVEMQNRDMVRTFLNNTLQDIDLEIKDKNGDTALLLAIKKGNLDIVDDILSQVPSPAEAIQFVQAMEASDLKDNLLKKLATAQNAYSLFLAIKNKETDKVKNIASLVDFSKIKSIYRNPFALAIKNNEVDVIKYFIDKNVDVNQVLDFGVTPLMIALDLEKPNNDIVELLLKKGANPNTMRFDGGTPLFMARNKPEILKLLIEYNADINYPIFDIDDPMLDMNNPNLPSNTTLLMWAASKRNLNLVENLLALGANPLLKNSEGKTARMIAKEKRLNIKDKKLDKIQNLLDAKEKEALKKNNSNSHSAATTYFAF